MACRSTSSPLLRVLNGGDLLAGSSGARSLSTSLPTLVSKGPGGRYVKIERKDKVYSSKKPKQKAPSSLPPVPPVPSNQPEGALLDDTPAFLPPDAKLAPAPTRIPVSPLYPFPYLPTIQDKSKAHLPYSTVAKFIDRLPPSPQALSTVARRLNLEDNDETAKLIVQALTHPSYRDGKTPNNLLLAEVGRSILGFVTSEYYGKKYPNLPTRALKLFMTALTNQDAMQSVASEVGVALGTGKQVRTRTWQDGVVGGVEVRYKTEVQETYRDVTSQARSVKMTMEELRIHGRKGGAVHPLREKMLASDYEGDAIISAVRALIGLVYQQKGFAAAATFINGHFISRQVDLPSLLKFEQPYKVLKSSVLRYGLSLPVGRLIKESGRDSDNPYFVVAYYSDDIKLGEGFGRSMPMASHRAATNALQTLYLASAPRPVLSIATLPTFPLTDSPNPTMLATELKYRALAPLVGESETLMFSSGRAPGGWQDPEARKAAGERGVETRTERRKAGSLLGGLAEAKEAERLMREERERAGRIEQRGP